MCKKTISLFIILRDILSFADFYLKKSVRNITRLSGPRREKTCLRKFANDNGADQPAHPRRLISAFVIRLSESIISRLATSEISIFQIVSIAEETGLKLALSETQKTGFLTTWPV